MPAGRYAPSPTGSLHLGNLRTALVAWLAARATDRAFLLRVEDLDRVRSGAEADQRADLAAVGLDWDAEPVRHVVGARLRMSPALDPAALRKGEVRMLNLHSSVLPKPDALSRIGSGTPRKRVPRVQLRSR